MKHNIFDGNMCATRSEGGGADLWFSSGYVGFEGDAQKDWNEHGAQMGEYSKFEGVDG